MIGVTAAHRQARRSRGHARRRPPRRTAGCRAAIGVAEAWNGPVDLNGDGDTGDVVLHVHDAATGATTNLGLAIKTVTGGIPMLSLRGELVAFAASEASMNRDLNQDGDRVDDVAHVVNVRTRVVTNLRDSVERVHFVGPLVAFAVDEVGSGVDHNLDGDVLDAVLAYRRASGGTVNVGLAALLAEDHQNARDHNQDGDFNDVVLEFTNVATGAAWNTHLALSAWEPSHGVNSGDHPRVVAEVDEAGSNSTDLNGDGDTNDVLLVRVDPATQTIEVVDRSISACAFGFSYFSQSDRFQPPVGGDRAIACVHEWVDGIDVNKDGDLDDATANVWRLDTGDLLASLGMLYARNAYPRWVGDRVYFEVDEADGDVDYTGDGSLNQHVVVRLDVASGAVDVVPWAVRSLSDGPKWVAGSHEVFVGMWEPSDGRDLNGNGSLNDLVLHVVR